MTINIVADHFLRGESNGCYYDQVRSQSLKGGSLHSKTGAAALLAQELAA